MKSSLLLLGLGGLVIEIRSPESLPFLRKKRFVSFQTNALASDIRWEYHIVAAGSLTFATNDPQINFHQARVNRLGDGNAILRMPQVQKRLEQTRDHLQWLTIEIHQGAVTFLDFKENRADMFLCREFANELGDHGIGPAMLAPFLANFDACLLHASAVVRNGKAMVFLAPDEGGKTTAARLVSSGGIILSDDQVLVRRFADGFRVYGTPWGLHMDGKLQAPLAGLFLLEKAGGFGLTPLTGNDVLQHIWEEVKNAFTILPRQLKKKAFDLVSVLTTQVPAWRMAFPKDYINWKAIDDAIDGAW